jgi:2-iminobutanoate/2-iminopropanoate deaminase
MKHQTQHSILALSLPLMALTFTAPVIAPQTSAQSPKKEIYRRLTPTSKTVNGQPLYSPEVSFGNLVFVSGKGPGTGFTGDIKAQTKNVLDQIEESLKLAGSSMEKVLKVNVYLTDMNNFAGMNEAYIGRFGSDPPVRTTVAVSAIPDGTLVEIDCIAGR